MIIKCKKTKRFLCEVNIEDYLKNIEKLGIVIERPLELIVPCKNCKTSEKYLIYNNRYEFKENVNKNLTKNI